MIDQGLTPEQIEAAKARRAAFVAGIPKATLDAEDKLPAVVARLNASTRSKLHRIYSVADEISKSREPFVACGKGCSACCHINVSITRAEAERVGATIGRRPVAVRASAKHAIDKFAGKPCPFLDGAGSCSINADRPLTCRKHVSFFEDDRACQADLMHAVDAPLVSFSGLDEALFAASAQRGEVVLADIRDFFPPERT